MAMEYHGPYHHEYSNFISMNDGIVVKLHLPFVPNLDIVDLPELVASNVSPGVTMLTIATTSGTTIILTPISLTTPLRFFSLLPSIPI
jgi:hypothetical protein